MSITPADLRQLRFSQVRRGYDTEAVDRALERVADVIEVLERERQGLTARVAHLEGALARYRETEDTLTQTLQLAERAAEEVKAEARAEAQRIVEAAHRPAAATSALPDPAFVELLGETRAIRSLLQTLLTQRGDDPPFAPRQ